MLVGCGATVVILLRDPALADRLLGRLGCGPGRATVTAQNRFLPAMEATGKVHPGGRTLLDHSPVKRLGLAEDLLCPVLWLLSPASELVTGVVAPVDGGFSAFAGV